MLGGRSPGVVTCRRARSVRQRDRETRASPFDVRTRRRPTNSRGLSPISRAGSLGRCLELRDRGEDQATVRAGALRLDGDAQEMTSPVITAPARPGLLRWDGACLREGVARRPGRRRNPAWMTPRSSLRIPTNRPRHHNQRWVEKCGRSIKGSETPHFDAVVNHCALAFVRGDPDLRVVCAMHGGLAHPTGHPALGPATTDVEVPMLGLLESCGGGRRLAVALRGETSLMVMLPLVGLRSLRTYDFSGAGHRPSRCLLLGGERPRSGMLCSKRSSLT